MTPSELAAAGVERGALEATDPRGTQVATCTLPSPSWQAVLLTEQWQTPGAVVTFADVVVGASVFEGRGIAKKHLMTPQGF